MNVQNQLLFGDAGGKLSTRSCKMIELNIPNDVWK